MSGPLHLDVFVVPYKPIVGLIPPMGEGEATIYITHGHGDHFFGLNTILDAFPDARAVTAAAVIPHDEVIRVLRRAVELGVTFIDTADSYGPGVSERLIREALHPYPEGLAIATKAGFTRPGPGRWERNGKPEYLNAQAEKSLRLLGLDRIELLQLHRIDPEVPPHRLDRSQRDRVHLNTRHSTAV